MEIYKNYIAGEWVPSQETIANINPSNTDDFIGEVCLADSAQLDAAITAADEASHDWARSGIQLRSDCLDQIGNELLARKDELGRLLAREEGKTLPEAMGEVGRAGQVFKFYAGEALRLSGDILPSVRPGIEVHVQREPLGVIGLITPWNFPIAIPAWKVAPSLAYGNTVVLKPSEITPASTWALAEIIDRAGLPAGVFNLVNGTGAEIGAALAADPRVAGISMTGSVETGRQVAATCAARGAKYQLEMGGKNPLVVMADAKIDVAIDCAINGAFFSTGQRCTASSRLIIEDAIHDQFVETFKHRMEALIVGDALKEGVHIGPAIDQRQLDKNQKYLGLAKKGDGATVLGGDLTECETPGFYMRPALIVDTTNNAAVNQEEIFGPIATTIKASGLDHALALANDIPFGLSAGICTTSLGTATAFRQRLKAGMVMVNLPTAGVDYHVPFGGMKGSSFGQREQGRYAAEFYTTVKTSYLTS